MTSLVTILTSIEYVKGRRTRINECDLDIYTHLFMINEANLWKDKN